MAHALETVVYLSNQAIDVTAMDPILDNFVPVKNIIGNQVKGMIESYRNQNTIDIECENFQLVNR